MQNISAIWDAPNLPVNEAITRLLPAPSKEGAEEILRTARAFIKKIEEILN